MQLNIKEKNYIKYGLQMSVDRYMEQIENSKLQVRHDPYGRIKYIKERINIIDFLTKLENKL